MTPDFNIFSGAQRLQSMTMSAIRKVMDRAKALQDAGYPVVSFSCGEPNFNTPKDIKDAVIHAIEDNCSHYGSNRGYPALRKEISKKVMRSSGVSYDPETEILVTTSCAEAINNTILSIADPSDEVIVFSPAFVNYENVSAMCGAKVVRVPLRKEDDFQINLDEVRKSLSPRTKIIVINNPCNPTGAVYSKQSLEELSKIICENNLIAVSDEIYCDLTYDGAEFHSLASFPGMRERTVVLNGFSKTYAMTGWRVGYLCADKRMVPNILKIHQYSTTCSPTFIQVGLAKAMNLPGTLKEVDFMVQSFAKKRKMLLDGLDRIPKLRYIKPYGAFYILVDVSQTGMSGADFASKLLEEKYVATVPGIGMGKELTDFIRISYATGDEDILEGLKRINEFACNF